jgi:hypothetical protein
MELDNQSTKGMARAKGGAKAKPGGKDIRNLKQSKTGDKPGWASGLRQIYDSVVDEPLPDSFNDLLAKLDRRN